MDARGYHVPRRSGGNGYAQIAHVNNVNRANCCQECCQIRILGCCPFRKFHPPPRLAQVVKPEAQSSVEPADVAHREFAPSVAAPGPTLYIFGSVSLDSILFAGTCTRMFFRIGSTSMRSRKRGLPLLLTGCGRPSRV